ncbi:hypothetical protein AHAS_Ahas13G0272000 [Arachis hypogaea]
MKAMNEFEGGFFSLWQYDGYGKMFLYNLMSTKIKSEDKIMVNVTSSEISSLLLSNNRITHSRFKIPLTVDEYSTCNI